MRGNSGEYIIPVPYSARIRERIKDIGRLFGRMVKPDRNVKPVVAADAAKKTPSHTAQPAPARDNRGKLQTERIFDSYDAELSADDITEVSRPTLVSSDEVIRTLNRISGWNESIEKALKMPDKLYIERDERFFLCSDSSGMQIINALRCLQYDVELDPTPKLPKYGIAIEATSSRTYFVLCDLERRVAMRVEVTSLYYTSDNDWEKILRPLASAVEAAEKNKDSIAVYNMGITLKKL